MKKRLKVGFIGMGGIAHTHVLGWQALPYAEVVAGCDVNPEVFPVWKKKLCPDHTGWDLPQSESRERD